jgi:catechol 2,3-dioxygenase-like lactoylglutathione lyase family enzyme
MRYMRMTPRNSSDPSPANGSDSVVTILGSPLSLPAKLLRKLIATAVSAYLASARLAYRLKRPWGGKLGHLDHITIPCHDAQIAEEFYVGLLGARIVNRINRSMLRRIGWRDADIDQNAAEHLSITFSGGPRLDLFVYPQGSPIRSASMHPHIALTVSPRRFLEWKRRLESRGVIVAGPTRPGLPGQASFYFNDPFGNHLELVTLGFAAFDLPVGVPDRSRLAYRWSRESAAA